MKLIQLLIASLIGLFLISTTSCTKDNDTTIPEKDDLGRWHLIETFVGTGGAGGEFKPVISNHTLDFTSDTTLISTGSLCSAYLDDVYTTATYSLQDSIIHPDCASQIKIHFSHQDTILILSWEAFCGFAYKYEKIEE